MGLLWCHNLFYNNVGFSLPMNVCVSPTTQRFKLSSTNYKQVYSYAITFKLCVLFIQVLRLQLIDTITCFWGFPFLFIPFQVLTYHIITDYSCQVELARNQFYAPKQQPFAPTPIPTGLKYNPTGEIDSITSFWGLQGVANLLITIVLWCKKSTKAPIMPNILYYICCTAPCKILIVVHPRTRL